MARVRRTFTPQFKKDAVALLREGRSATEVAQSLGIARSLLQRWKDQLEKKKPADVFPGSGQRPPEIERIHGREPRHVRLAAGVRDASAGGLRLRAPSRRAAHARRGDPQQDQTPLPLDRNEAERDAVGSERPRSCVLGAGDRAWAADITTVRTGEGWLHLAVVLDLFSRRIVGWATSERVHQTLALEALAMAIARRRPGPGLIHHSDGGGQYASAAYQDLLDRHGLVASMSRPANCLDNAVAESFFHTLKTELVYHDHYRTREAARLAIFEWIEGFYNRTRLHSTLGYRSPEEYETIASIA